MTQLTIWEIFGNPLDLAFKVTPDENRTYAAVITRGPGHRYKLLLSGDAIPTKRKALKLIRDALLLSIRESKALGANQRECLTMKHVKRIMSQLASKEESDTSTWKRSGIGS